MAAMVIRGNAKAAWLAGLASLRARASGVVWRLIACAAAAVLVCAVGAALVQVVAQMLSLSVPMAVTGITVIAAALVNSLRRHLRTGRVTSTARQPARRPAVSPPGSGFTRSARPRGR
jgi:hypothetical protein